MRFELTEQQVQNLLGFIRLGVQQTINEAQDLERVLGTPLAEPEAPKAKKGEK